MPKFAEFFAGIGLVLADQLSRGTVANSLLQSTIHLCDQVLRKRVVLLVHDRGTDDPVVAYQVA